MGKVKSFTTAQRNYILRRDGNRCQFRYYQNGKWVRCSATRGLQVHHIIPRGWASKHLPKGFLEEEVNGRSNLITLCSKHHICLKNGTEDCVHPDTEIARKKYGSGNKDAYREMVKDREDLNNRGKPYWNTVFDWMFRRLTDRANREFDEDYPKRRR